MLHLLKNKALILWVIILLVACKENKPMDVTHSVEKCEHLRSINGISEINGKKTEFLATELNFRKDSFLLSEIEYSKEGFPIKETLYGTITDSLGYGLVIFYDSNSNKIKHVEIIAIKKSVTGSKRYKIFSQRQLKAVNQKAYEKWMSKLQDDGFNYPIDTYH